MIMLMKANETNNSTPDPENDPNTDMQMGDS